MSNLSTHIPCLQAATTHAENPNDSITSPVVPPLQQQNYFSARLHHFMDVQNNHHRRFYCLFPDINPATLDGILGNHIHM
jgi:hypothetical protein